MRTRSKAPVTPEQLVQQTHKRFDDDEDVPDKPAESSTEVEAPKPKRSSKRSANRLSDDESSGDDEAPEQVQKSAAEIERLREEHEQILEDKPAKKAKRKRRLTEQAAIDAELDLSVLEAVAKQQEAQQTDEEEQDEDDQADNKMRIVVHSKGKKLNTHKIFEKQEGNINVRVLGRGRAAEFPVKPVGENAKVFMEDALSSVKRKRYAAFAAAKRAKPAKVFAATRR